MTWMITHSRQRFNLRPSSSEKETIHWDDVATHLAKQCRFNGACPGFYSVAEHSVHVSHLVPEPLRFHALLHDAAETYLGDLITPVKRDCPAYVDAEHRIMFRIYCRLGIQPPSVAEARVIKAADNAMLAAEKETFFPGTPPYEHLIGVVPADIHIVGLEWQEARQLFIQRFDELKPTELEHT